MFSFRERLTFLLQRKLLRPDENTSREDIHAVVAGIEILLHFPVDGHLLSLARVLDVFFDRVGQFAVFVGKGVGSIFGQDAVVRLGNIDVEDAFARVGGDILVDGKVDDKLLYVFHPTCLASASVGSQYTDV